MCHIVKIFLPFDPMSSVHGRGGWAKASSLLCIYIILYPKREQVFRLRGVVYRGCGGGGDGKKSEEKKNKEGIPLVFPTPPRRGTNRRGAPDTKNRGNGAVSSFFIGPAAARTVTRPLPRCRRPVFIHSTGCSSASQKNT